MKNRKYFTKKKDLIALLIINFIAIIISLLIQAPFLVSACLFLGLPCLYLIIRGVNFRKPIIGAVSFGLVYGFTFDFIAEVNQAWSWNGGLVFKDKILGIIPFDNMIWFFFWVLYILLFYEHFLDRGLSQKISKGFKEMFVVGLIGMILVLAIYFIDSRILKVPYAYLSLCMVASIGFLTIAKKHIKLIKKIFPITFFFFLIYFSYELVALHLNQWSFPGQYIGWIDFSGLRFPFEELIFWMIFSSLFAAAYYEASIDDYK